MKYGVGGNDRTKNDHPPSPTQKPHFPPLIVQTETKRKVEIIYIDLYSDDVVMFCRIVNDADKILTSPIETCKRFGLTISF